MPGPLYRDPWAKREAWRKSPIFSNKAMFRYVERASGRAGVSPRAGARRAALALALRRAEPIRRRAMRSSNAAMLTPPAATSSPASAQPSSRSPRTSSTTTTLPRSPRGTTSFASRGHDMDRIAADQRERSEREGRAREEDGVVGDCLGSNLTAGQLDPERR